MIVIILNFLVVQYNIIKLIIFIKLKENKILAFKIWKVQQFSLTWQKLLDWILIWLQKVSLLFYNTLFISRWEISTFSTEKMDVWVKQKDLIVIKTLKNCY